LKIKAPAPLPADLQEKLKERKPEILRILEAMSWLRAQLETPSTLVPLFVNGAANETATLAGGLMISWPPGGR
jgi:hypothetical protein